LRVELPLRPFAPPLDERPLVRPFDALVLERDLDEFGDVLRRAEDLVWAMVFLL
jgi:hypothetical protein